MNHRYPFTLIILVVAVFGAAFFPGCGRSKEAPVVQPALPPPPPPPPSPLVPGTELSNVNIGNKILTEATVLSVTETSVSFRSGRSIVNVPTGQLPTDLRERAYLQVKAALHYKPDPPRASSRPGRPAPRVQDPISSSASNQTPSDDLSSIRRFAYNEAAQYFRYEYQAGTGDSSSRGINISACEEVVGWEGQYRAVGSAQVNQYDGYNAENRRTVGFEIIITRNAGGGLTRSSFTLR